jgi:hypothetical protein
MKQEEREKELQKERKGLFLTQSNSTLERALEEKGKDRMKLSLRPKLKENKNTKFEKF